MLVSHLLGYGIQFVIQHRELTMLLRRKRHDPISTVCQQNKVTIFFEGATMVMEDARSGDGGTIAPRELNHLGLGSLQYFRVDLS